MIAAVNPVVAAAASLSSRTREVPLPRPHTSVSLSPPRDRLHPYQPWAPSAGAGGVAFQQLGIAGMARATQANPGAGYFPAPLSERARPTTAAWADVRPASARDQARIAFFTARGDATSRATTGASTTTTTTTTRFFPEPQYEAPGSADGGGGQDSFVLDGEQWYRYDDESGYEYFYNETTGISQWEDPRPKAADGHRSTVGYDGTGTMQGLAGSNSGGSERERGRSALGARESVGLQAKGGSGDDEGQAMARGVGSYFAGAPQDAGSGSKTVGDGRGSAFKATLGGLGAASKTAAKDGDLDVSAIAKDTGDGIVMKAVEAAKAKGSRNSDADSKAESEVKRAETSQAADAKLSASPKESERKPVDHKYEKFRKMLQAGVPTAAVANKMRLAGLDPDPLVSSFTPTHAAKATAANSASSPRKKGSLPDKPEYEKFRKMLKAGVPKQAVIAKMRSEGADASPLEDDAETGAASKKPTPRRSSPKKGLPDDPKYDKYRKMLKAGVPRAAVAAKMKTEGLDASCFMDDDASPSSRREGRQNKLVNIHWKPVDDLPPERLRKSVWANSEGDPDLENDDIEALESLFSTKSAKVDKASATKRTGSRSSGSGKRLLDGRRINNIEIGLARFKAFSSYNELCECVVRQDFSRLDIDSVSTLISMLPTDQEIQMMRRVPKDDVADLGKAEQWFYCIASAYPRFGSKLRTFKTISCFDENRAQCTRDISLVQDASDTILESSSFAVILQRLLAVGNILNEGTYRGNATSISLDSLLSVTTTKGADRKTTVLDYVVRRCLDKNEVRVLSFADDFQGPVQDAARLSVSEMKAEVARLKEGVAAAERLVKALKDGNEVAELDQEFIQKTEAFCEAKAAEVDLLDQRMQTAESRGLELVEYFAEEPRVERIPDVFKTLRQFLTAFRASVDKCKRQIKSEERKKRQKDTQKDGKESSRGSRTKR
uniref:Formin-like protein n=1 Tax=Pinguiococcus pyrenoidosus TaxID=172671 RepID=A0A7R9YEI9_9STRA